MQTVRSSGVETARHLFLRQEKADVLLSSCGKRVIGALRCGKPAAFFAYLYIMPAHFRLPVHHASTLLLTY